MSSPCVGPVALCPGAECPAAVYRLAAATPQPERCPARAQDETDSGLDIDALKTVAAGVNAYRSESNGIVLITHYQRLLDYIKPDFVHIMSKGQIVRSGGPELALELEQDGYKFLQEAA